MHGEVKSVKLAYACNDGGDLPSHHQLEVLMKIRQHGCCPEMGVAVIKCRCRWWRHEFNKSAWVLTDVRRLRQAHLEWIAALAQHIKSPLQGHAAHEHV